MGFCGFRDKFRYEHSSSINVASNRKIALLKQLVG
jgi:hypothetical protein